jgi:glutamate synthase (ferredoxin)
MTGGTVVVLGPVGRNFAAGMSGGVAYVYDPHGELERRCNLEMVELQRCSDTEEGTRLRSLLERFAAATRSSLAAELLADWAATCARLVRVMPRDFERMQAAIARAEAAGLSGAEAEAAAFEENAHALERAGGN